jgi:hypothetical protein
LSQRSTSRNHPDDAPGRLAALTASRGAGGLQEDADCLDGDGDAVACEELP